MAVRRVPEITAGQENLRLEHVPGLRAVTLRRDPVKPLPAGAYVAMVFRVTGYDRDCDGSLMARLECVDADGEGTGWEPANLGLHPGSAWAVDGPGDLEALAAAGGGTDG